MNSDLFSDKSFIGKQFKTASSLLQKKELHSFENTEIMRNSQATAAMSKASESLSANTGGPDDFITDTMSKSLAQLGFSGHLSSEIACLIERIGFKSRSYYYCPWVEESPKFIATNEQTKLKQQQNCQDICKQRAKCNPLIKRAYTTFVNNKNYLDESSYVTVEMNAQKFAKNNKIDEIYLTERDSNGNPLYSKTIKTSFNISSVHWNKELIPSSKIISSQFILKTKFMGDNYYTASTVGNTYVIKPKILYYANIDGRDILNNLEGNTLYSIVFSSHDTKYQCPLPLLSNNLYSNQDVCTNACVEQHECLFKVDSVSIDDTGNFGLIKNHCKNVEVTIDGVNKSLEQAVNDGDCKLRSEISIDDYQKAIATYIENGLPGKDYAIRPDIGFQDGRAILSKERATEIAYAFNDMLRNGKDDGYFDESDKLNNKMFRDFDWKKSNDLFDAIAVVQGPSKADMNVNLLIKLNDAYFNKHRYIGKDENDLNSSFEREVYEAMKNTLQLPYMERFVRSFHLNKSSFDKQKFQEKLYKWIFDNNDDNTVGIVVGLLDIDTPIVKDEKTSSHIKFRILDKNREFRTVAVSYFIPGLDKYQAEVYAEFLRVTGREVPSYSFLLQWADYAKKNNLTQKEIGELFKKQMKDNPGIYINSYADYLKPLPKTSLNKMLTNYSLGLSGEFNPNTISFETTSNPTYNSIPVFVNKDVYESKVSTAYTILKTYYNDQSLISLPLNLTKNSLGPTSSYQHQYRYLFTYVDKIKNLKNLTVKELMDKFYEDYKSGRKKFYVWDLRNNKDAIRKYSNEATSWHDSENLNHYGQFFPTDSFPYLGNSDIVSTFYEDISQNHKDRVYIGKRGDSYILKFSTHKKRIIYGGKACPEGYKYDGKTNKCIYDKTIGGQDACPGGVYNPTNKKCYEQSTRVAIGRIGDNYLSGWCLIKTYTATLNIQDISKIKSFVLQRTKFDDYIKVEVNGHVVRVGPYGGDRLNLAYYCSKDRKYYPSREECSKNCLYVRYACSFPSVQYAANKTGACELSTSWDQYHNIDVKPYLVNGKNIFKITVEVAGDGEAYALFNAVGSGMSCGDSYCSTTTTVSTRYFEPNCPSGYSVNSQGRCYKKVSEVTNAACPDDTWKVDRNGMCYKDVSDLSKTINKNGYYFVYLQKDNNPNIKFLTPIVYKSPIRCKKESYQCSLDNVVYNSQTTCQKYCRKVGNSRSVVYGRCKNISSSSLPDLIDKSFYKMETCNAVCFKKESKKLNYIKVRLRIGDDIANKKGDIVIKKILSNGTSFNYSNQIIVEPNSKNIYLSEDNRGIKIGSFEKGSSIQIKYSTSYDGSKYRIGIGREIKAMLNDPKNIIPGYLNVGRFGSCVNMRAYYPNMGLYLDIDKDDDGVYEDKIKISETFVCYPNYMTTLIQNISFDGNKIDYDYVDELGNITRKSKEITILNHGVCKLNKDNNDYIPLAKSYIANGYIPNPSIVQVNSPDSSKPIKATMDFYSKPFASYLGIVDKNLNRFMNFLNNPGKNVDDWRKEINVNKNIPIPFYEGVSIVDKMDIILNNTNIDWYFNNALRDYKIKAGFGFVPWKQCKSLQGDVTTTKYVYVNKTDCGKYMYSYDAHLKKCVGDRVYNPSTGSYVCPYGVFNGSQCEIVGDCPDGYSPDPTNSSRCFKALPITKKSKIQICKPWWRILRTYQCDNVGRAFDYSNFVTFGPPRWVEIPDPSSKITIYKNLAIDKDGNIIDASKVVK